MSLWDSETRRLFRKAVERYAPLTNQVFFGRKYILPKYRESDYLPLEPLNVYDLDRLMQFAAEGLTAYTGNDVNGCAIGTCVASLAYKRPVLWLEKELAEMLLRTRLLDDLSTGDIKWKWPAFRIMLPIGPLSIDREDGIRSLAYFDICKIARHPVGDELAHCEPKIAKEIDALASKLTGYENKHTLEGTDFGFGKDHGVCICSGLDRSEVEGSDQTLYASTKPWGDIKVSNYSAHTEDLNTPFLSDDLDRGLLHRLEHLVLNILIFMSSTPLLYDTEIIRRMSMEGKHMVPGLLRARFVGQTALKPIRVAHPDAVPGSSGRHHAAHWVCGHWKRQKFGPGLTQEKIIWIQPYQTSDFEEKTLAEKH